MNKLKKVSSILDYVLPIVASVIGVLLISSIWNCYFNGTRDSEGVFSVGNVNKYFSWSIAPLILLILLVIFGGVLKIILVEQEKRQNIDNIYLRFQKAYNKVHKNSLDTIEQTKLLKTIKIAFIVSCLVIFICFVITILYFIFNKLSFDKDLVSQSIDVLAHVSPFILLTLISITVFKSLFDKSALEYIRLSFKVNASEIKPTIDVKRLWIIRGVVLLIALSFIVIGIVNKGYLGVFEKAAKICQECIGIG